jgi:hypothetical protein
VAKETLEAWLNRKKFRHGVIYRLLAALALLASLLILFLTFWFTYAVVWIIGNGVSALNREWEPPHVLRLVCSAVFMVLLFIQHLKTNPWHWGTYPKADYTHALKYTHRLGAVTMLLYPSASANIIADILMTGPRLFFAAFNLWNQGMALRRMDTSSTAQLVAFLLTRDRSVPYEEFSAAGWDNCLEQLRIIDGVMFLEKGVKVSEEFRSELAHAIASGDTAQANPDTGGTG